MLHEEALVRAPGTVALQIVVGTVVPMATSVASNAQRLRRGSLALSKRLRRVLRLLFLLWLFGLRFWLLWRSVLRWLFFDVMSIMIHDLLRFNVIFISSS